MDTNNSADSKEKCVENKLILPQISGQRPCLPIHCWGPPPPLPQFRPLGPPPWMMPPSVVNNQLLPGTPPPQPPGMFSSPPPALPSWAESVNSQVAFCAADQQWLGSWIESRSFKKKEVKLKTDQSLKISEAQRKLKICAFELKKLKVKHEALCSDMQSCSQEDWDENWAEIDCKMSNVSCILNSFSKPECLSHLNAELLKRSKKRKRLRQQQTRRKVEVYQRQVKRQNLHKQADSWLAYMQHTVERARRDENLKQEADLVLSEVTRRQSDGRRQIALLEALQKLRRARIQAVEAQNGSLSSEQKKQADQSNTVIVRLLGLWSRQMEEYSKEERGLRVMLEESAAKQSDIEIQNVRRTLCLWEACMFGLDSKLESEGPDNFDALASVRYAWDQFLVPENVIIPMASTIPVGWVLPTTPSSLEWQKWLLHYR